MDSQKLEYYKQKLLTKKASIVAELNQIATLTEEGHYEAKYQHIGDDEEENAQEREGYERDILVEGTLEDTLSRIDRALARIEAGTYGRDIHTGDMIDEARLEVLPEAEEAIS